jgi:hypothetical protein
MQIEILACGIEVVYDWKTTEGMAKWAMNLLDREGCAILLKWKDCNPCIHSIRGHVTKDQLKLIPVVHPIRLNFEDDYEMDALTSWLGTGPKEITFHECFSEEEKKKYISGLMV